MNETAGNEKGMVTNMNERIRKHISELFADAPKTRKAAELKEEMAQNAIEKYQDLVNEGYQEEDAFRNVIGSIGDVTELFDGLKDRDPLAISEEDRKKKAMLTSIAAGLYIFAGVTLIACMAFGATYFYMEPQLNMLGLALAGLICIPPTCMLVYASNRYPSYQKKEENFVEIYKETVSRRSKEKSIQSSVSVIVWMVTLIVYFLISFVSRRWDMSWITFLMGACAQAIVTLIFNLRRSQ